jgi:hypothetical protein
MITGVGNHENLTLIIKQATDDEHYQTKLKNNGITRVNVSSDYAYRSDVSIKLRVVSK